MVNFTKLWHVSFSHKYYKVQPYRGFTIVPFNTTDQKVRAYGLVLKPVNGEITVFYKEESSKPSLLYTLNTPLKLSFFVFCNDNLLLNYSDVELDDFTQCFFLSNAYASAENNQCLHPGNYLSQEQRIRLISGYNELDTYIGSDDSSIRVSTDIIRADDKNENAIFKGKYLELKKQFSFSDLTEKGYVNIHKDEINEYVSIYALEQKKQKLFAILELTLMPQTLPAETMSYSVVIGAKPVTWRYNIIEKNQTVFNDFNIYLGKHPLKLKPVTKTVLGNGAQAFVLETSEPIVLSEIYDNYYEVEFSHTDVKAGQLTSRKRVGLPVPDINRIKISKSAEGPKAYSDMYIYL
jgi:hypothetical protein